MAKIVPQPHGGSLKIPEKWDRFNPRWRPKSLFKRILESTKGLKRRELPTKQDIQNIIFMLADLTGDELNKVANDKNANYLVKRLARFIATEEDHRVIEFILSRTIGTPTSGIGDITVNVNNNHLELTEQNIAFFQEIERMKALPSEKEQ